MTENKIFKVIVVDDEPDSRTLLRTLIYELEDVEVVAEAGYGEEAFFLILEHMPNLVLMDINMPGKSGMEVTALLQKRIMNVPIVFISAYKDYAIAAIRNNVYDFLLKPVFRDDLHELIQKYRRFNQKHFQGRIEQLINTIPEEVKIRINSRNSYILVNPAEIVYCQSLDGYTQIFLANGKKEIASSTLSHMEERLERWHFYRLGRSLLINLDYIRHVDKSLKKCLLKSKFYSWELYSSNAAIKELIDLNFSYATK